MRIGIDVSSVVYGSGVSNYTQELVKNLPTKDVLPFGFSLRRGSELKAIISNAKVYAVPLTVLEWLWNQVHMINVESVVGPMDVYHSSDWVQAPSNAKKVTTIHDLSPFLFPQETDSKIVAVHTRRMKWVTSECDKIICVSENTASDLKKLFKVPEEKIVVIYEAMPAFFKTTPAKTQYTDYIVTIGAKQPRKNISRLVSAFTKFGQKYELPAKLIVIGERPKGFQSSDTIEYTGFVSDQKLVDILTGAKTLVYPSLYEGFGLPILGAFYHNVPVACSNTSSLPEVAGPAAEYFDPTAEEEIAKAIGRAILNKSDLIKKGKKQLTKFSWEDTSKKTMEVYKTLC